MAVKTILKQPEKNAQRDSGEKGWACYYCEKGGAPQAGLSSCICLRGVSYGIASSLYTSSAYERFHRSFRIAGKPIPQCGQLRIPEMDCLTVLEARRPKSKCQQGRAPPNPSPAGDPASPPPASDCSECSLAHGSITPASHYLLPASLHTAFRLHLSVPLSKSPPFYKGTTQMTLF